MSAKDASGVARFDMSLKASGLETVASLADGRVCSPTTMMNITISASYRPSGSPLNMDSATTTTTTTTAVRAPKSPFMTLPTEITLLIYELVLVQPHPLSVRPVSRGNEDDIYTRPLGKRSLVYHNRTSYQPPLLRVCGQIRAEALPEFWSKNLFRLVLDIPGCVVDGKRWMKSLSPTALREVRWLQLGDECAGHVIVDLREGGVRFRRSEVVGEDWMVGKGCIPEGNADGDVSDVREEEEDAQAWQACLTHVVGASEEHVQVVGGYVKGKIEAHEVSGKGWTKVELMELAEVAAEEGKKDRRKRSAEWWDE